MYILKTALLSIIRNKRRNIISCLLLAASLSVIIGGVFYHTHYSSVISDAEDTYNRKVTMIFRDDLQYMGNRYLSSLYIGWEDYSSEGELLRGFDDELMSEYNHPYPFTREMFEKAGESELAESMQMSYTAIAYRIEEGTPDSIGYSADLGITADRYKGTLFVHQIVGGSMDSFYTVMSDNSYNTWSASLDQGEWPDKGECCLPVVYAEKYNKKVGDMLELYDVDGNEIAQLRISGLTRFYAVTSTRYSLNNRTEIRASDEMSRYNQRPSIGTPYDRVGREDEEHAKLAENYRGYYTEYMCMNGIIFTDFETAYYLYGTEETDPDFSERHHFNNYTVTYDLKNAEDIEEFENTVIKQMDSEYIDEFTIENFYYTLDKRTEMPKVMLDRGTDLIVNGGIFGAVVIMLSFILQIKDRKNDIGLYSACGIKKSKIISMFALEACILCAVSSVISFGGGWLVHKFYEDSYAYIKKEALDYSIRPQYFAVMIISVIAAAVMSGIISWVFLKFNSPTKLLRRE